MHITQYATREFKIKLITIKLQKMKKSLKIKNPLFLKSHKNCVHFLRIENYQKFSRVSRSREVIQLDGIVTHTIFQMRKKNKMNHPSRKATNSYT